MSSQLIVNNQIIKDEWEIINLPKIDTEVKKQAGKVVIYKLTGDKSPSQEQITQTVFPNTGKVILPMRVFIEHKDSLESRLNNREIGIWIDTHEDIEVLNESIDITILPIIAVRVGT